MKQFSFEMDYGHRLDATRVFYLTVHTLVRDHAIGKTVNSPEMIYLPFLKRSYLYKLLEGEAKEATDEAGR